MLEEEGAVVNVHGVLEVVQHTLVLLGNANELISQTRDVLSSNVWITAWKSMEKIPVRTMVTSSLGRDSVLS